MKTLQAIGAALTRTRAALTASDDPNAFLYDEPHGEHPDASLADLALSPDLPLSLFPEYDPQVGIREAERDATRRLLEDQRRGLSYGWLFDVVGVYCYDSYYRLGYTPTSSNPRGYHWAQDFSRYKSGGKWRSLAGRKIKAPLDGTVVRSGWNDYWGWYVRIDFVDGKSWLFAHLKYRSFGGKTGQKIHRGDLIGYVGHSGNAYGDHLHLERWYGHDDVRDPRWNPFNVYGPDYKQIAA